MRKSLRLLFASFVLAASVAAVAATTTNNKAGMASGGDPVPICPPGLCAIN
jgi:Spy/CpxP family protein refolding chaperone